MRFDHEPRYEDELRLIKDDFIYVTDDEVKQSADSWCTGVSWLSGTTGMLPLTYTEVVAETETWTMHRSVTCISSLSFITIYQLIMALLQRPRSHNVSYDRQY